MVRRETPQYVLDKQGQYMMAMVMWQFEDREADPRLEVDTQSGETVLLPEDPLELTEWSAYDTGALHEIGLETTVKKERYTATVQVHCEWSEHPNYHSTVMNVSLDGNGD